MIFRVDFRHSIQAEIITPFINDFNKENYINNPIPVSDNTIKAKISSLYQSFLLI